MEQEESVLLVKTNPKRTRAKKTVTTGEIAEVVKPVGRSLSLRPIKWNHVLGQKPRKEDIVAVRYLLKTGLEFTTRFADHPQTTLQLESDTTTYISAADEEGKYFQLSFYPSDQRIHEFDTMALIGERGEIVYLYEF